MRFPRAVSWTLTADIIEEFVPDVGRSVFVETGTHRGGGIELARSLGFREIYSCDVSDEHVENAQEKFGDADNVTIELSDSLTFLRKWVGRLDGFAVFWLDAHGVTSTPILEELEVVVQHPGSKLVLIDDIRYFRGGVRWAAGVPFPKLEEAASALGGELCYRDSKLYANDVLCLAID